MSPGQNPPSFFHATFRRGENFPLTCHMAPFPYWPFPSHWSLALPLTLESYPPPAPPAFFQKEMGEEVKVLTVESHIMVGEYRWPFGFGGAIDSKSDRAIRCLHRVSLQENRSSSGRSQAERKRGTRGASMKVGALKETGAKKWK